MFRKRMLVLGLALLGLLALTAAATNLGRLTLVNNSNKTAYIWLQSETNFYYFENPASQTKIWTPAKGEYSYRLAACGTTVTGTLDLSQAKTIIVPVCGSKATSNDITNQIDVGRLIRLVRVEFHNATGGRLLLVFHGPDGYVFTIKAGETGEYTIPRGDYTYTAYACGTAFRGDFFASAHAEKTIKCP